MKIPRRIFLMSCAATGVLALPTAHAQSMVDENSPQAKGLAYVADAKKVDTKKYPKFNASQNCASCALYQGKGAAGGCALFPGKQVAAKGWCNAWVKKA